MRSACRKRDGVALGKIVAPGDVETERHQRKPEQQPGNDAGHEQMRDRNGAARRERIDHHVVRGRDQQRLQRARDRDVDGKEARIAAFDHLRDHHRADRGRVGHRGSRDAAEHGRGENVHQRKAAADEADEHLGEIDDALRHPAFGHDGAGENEEGNGEERKIVHAVGCLERDRFERNVHPERRKHGREAERISDRHAHQRKER